MAIKLGPVLNATARISQKFGENPDIYQKYGFAGHEGVDLVADPGVIVASATGGSVLSAGDTKGNYGNAVVVWDPVQNCKTLYAHLKDIVVKKDDVISDGDTIGHVGGTGVTTGWHLHFSACRTQVKKNFNVLTGTTTIQTPDPLNPTNGYKGWEDPLDSSIFDWPVIWLSSLGPSGQVPSVKGGVSGVEATGAVLTWEEIFAKYYAGWGEAEARADYNITMHGDINLLYQARGIDPNAPVKPPRIRDEALNKKYYLIEALGGLTLNEIHNGGISLGRVDLLSGFLGIDPNFNIPAGYEFNLAGFPAEYYPDSSEWKGFKKMVGIDPIGVPGDWFIRPQDAWKTLFDIRGEYNMAFRTDVLAGYLNITDRMKIPPYQGFGTSGFPNFQDTGSGEVQAFKTLFSQTPPQQTKPPAESVFGKTIEMPPSETAIPPESIPEAAEEVPPAEEQPPAEQPPAGEGGATLDSIDKKIDTINTKADNILAKLAEAPAPAPVTPPPAEEATGGIFISSTPARASIYIDGAFQYDYTPSNFTYKIKPGDHEVRLKLKGYQDYREIVKIVENETLNLDIALVAV